jgi:hypothetical protein
VLAAANKEARMDPRGTKSTDTDLANVLWAAVREMHLYADSQAFDPELGERIVAVAAAVDDLRKELEARAGRE